ncbi:MAG TPA: phosphoribosylanthranilate isomerase [Thiohalobacter sp.]|nr:phosphoribosylanthranilate isomerase [Thiohalobacter sp.]
MRVRVKICGITRPGDGAAAAAAGADAIGLVFHASSPRAVGIEQARAVITALPPFVCRVGLFVDAGAEKVRAHLEALPLDLLQFHGDETPQFCDGLGHPYIKALRMHPGLDVAAAMQAWRGAAGILLDAWHPAVPGGSGERFDWARIPAERPRPLILAGGLNAANVEQAVRSTRPYAVDVSSGVEQDKGIKDPAKIAAFIQGVNRANTD